MTVSMLGTGLGTLLDTVPGSGDWGWLLVDLSWKSLVVLLAIVGVDRLCLRRRPLAADAVWFTTLLVLMLLPLFSLLAPATLGWRIALVHRRPPVTAGSAPTDAPYHRLRVHDQPRIDGTQVGDAAAGGAIDSGRSAWLFDSLANDTRGVALVVYLGVATLLAVRLAAGYLLATWLARRSEALDQESWTSRLAIHRRKLGIGRNVSLGLSRSMLAPATVGWWRPVILLPLDLRLLTDQATIDAILLHELIHIARFDYPTQIGWKLCQCVYWWNPLVWHAARRAAEAREAISDGYCVATLGGKEAYVGLLLDTAKRLVAGRVPPLAVAMARTPRLQRRLELLHSVQVAAPRASKRQRSVMAAIGLALLVFGGIVQGVEPEGAPAGEKAAATIAEDGAAKDAVAKDSVAVEFYVAESEAGEGLKEAKVEGKDGDLIYLHEEPVLTRADIAQARPGIDNNGGRAVGGTFTEPAPDSSEPPPPGGRAVYIMFTEAGAVKMGKASGENIGKRLAIVVDGKVIYAAKIRSKITNGARITFSRDDAERLVQAIDPSSPVSPVDAEKAAAAGDARSDSNRIKEMGIVLQNYYDVHKQFPDVAFRDSTGKPLLSWRVAILPFVDSIELYKQFHLDEPWDSEHNRTLIDKMPDVFHSAKTEKGRTRFLAPVGEKLAFQPNKGGLSMDAFTDGLSTILVVEADTDHAVVWTKPEDLVVDLKSPKRGITDGEATFMFLLAEGSASNLKGSIRPDILRALLTRNGGEKIDFDEVARNQVHVEQ